MTKNDYKIRIYKIISAIVFCVVLLFCTVESVYANDSITYLDESGMLVSCDSYTLVNGELSELSDGFYCVCGEIETGGRIVVNVTSSLILCDNAKLTLNKGIHVASGATLTIYAQSAGESMGELEAKGEVNDAGIGGANGDTGGTIIINGGKVTATGGDGAAGVGGGYNGAGGTIIINGGKVTATGGDGAAGVGGGAGIGGGACKDGGNIEIKNGDVTATGGSGGAGIGGGGPLVNSANGGDGGTILIINGKVTATGNGGGAGIGGGNHGGRVEDSVTINNGQVTVKGSDGGAGIGGGSGGSDGIISINGGKVIDLGKVVIPEEKDDHKDTEKSFPLYVQTGSNANHLPIILQSFGGKANGGVCAIERQGLLCIAAFKAATPVGYAEAFSFNLNLDATGRSKYNYDKKVGKLVLDIPAQYQKVGRKFAVIGIDKFGKTMLFSDIDVSDKTFTINLDIEGYAFSLIYSDLTSMGNKSSAASVSAVTNGTYVVQSGDCLSQIADKVKKSVKYLADKNGIMDVDRLSIGQVIKY